MIAKGQTSPISMRWQSTWPSKDIFHEYAQDFVMPVRSVLKCKAEIGICRTCYGWSMATGKMSELGDAVGSAADGPARPDRDEGPATRRADAAVGLQGRLDRGPRAVAHEPEPCAVHIVSERLRRSSSS